MDLPSASKLGGKQWQVVRLGGLLCLVVACVLLISALLSASRAGLAPLPSSFTLKVL